MRTGGEMTTRTADGGFRGRIGLLGWFGMTVLVCLLLRAAGADAAPTWLAPSKLSNAGLNAETPQVSVDAQGDVLSVWSRGNVVEAAGRPAAGAWQMAVALSDSKKEAFAPQVALDGSGDAVVAW